VANRTRLPEAPLADVNGGVVPRKGMAELLGAHRLRLRLAVTVFAWFTVSLVSCRSGGLGLSHFQAISSLKMM
jgi:hypothetical protein